MQNVFMTGASSFLGKSLGKRLLNDGYNVSVIVRRNTNKERLPLGLLSENIFLYDGSTDSMVSAINSSEPEIIFHLASLYLRETSVESVEPLVQSNLLIGIQLLEALRETKIGAPIVNFGTYAQYYENDGQTKSLNVYAALKNAFADILELYVEELDLRHLHLILYDCYGTGDWRTKLLPTIKECHETAKKLKLSDPNQIIDLTHIDDVVSAVIGVIDVLPNVRMPHPSNHIYAITGERLSLAALMDKVQMTIGYNLSVKWNAYPISKQHILKPWLGLRPPHWNPTITLDEGLKSYLLDDALPDDSSQ